MRARSVLGIGLAASGVTLAMAGGIWSSPRQWDTVALGAGLALAGAALARSGRRRRKSRPRPAEQETLSAAPYAASALFDLVNDARERAGQHALAWDARLADVAESHAWDVYRSGFFSHHSPTHGSLPDRLDSHGLDRRYAGENIGWASGPLEIHRQLMSSRGHRANIQRPDFAVVGIGVVQGPEGMIAVQVFTA